MNSNRKGYNGRRKSPGSKIPRKHSPRNNGDWRSRKYAFRGGLWFYIQKLLMRIVS